MEKIFSKTSRYSTESVQTENLGIASPVPMGSWNKAIMYQKLNYVRHNQATYLAKKSNTNFEPGVATNWEDVWMLFNYDGGSVSPDGTYPNMTVGNSPKSLYNLGAYDTYVDNGDGTVTVTRKTWRYDVPINNFIVSGDHFEQSISLPNGSSLGYATDTGYNANATSNVYKLGFYGVDKSFYVSVDNWLRIWDSSYSKDATGLAQFKAALEAAGGMYILYETTTSFTEKLPANVPINTLDKNMSDIVHDEVEKTLNLCQVKDPTTGSRIYIGTVSAGTYSICLNENPVNNIGYQFQLFPNPSTTTPIITDNVISTKTTFTVTETTDLYIYVNGKVGTFSVMLNAGSNIYPYQPYNGAIVHEIRTPLYFSTDNVSPASIDQIGGNWTSLGGFMVGGNTIYAWKKA